MFSNSVLEINLNIIRDNYLSLKKLISSEVAAVVKANAYGLGATPIIEILKDAGCNKFFVANLQEALQIRDLFKDIKIYVLNGIFAGYEKYFFHNNLVPILNNLEQVRLFNNLCICKSTKLDAVFHIDTGLNRLGLTESEIDILLGDPSLYSNISVDYIISHLACAEEENNEFNIQQFEKFMRLKQGFGDIKASIANSCGIMLGHHYHLDLVRPGAAIYGFQLNNKMSFLNNPIRLFSKLIQVKEVAKGQKIGYNLTHEFKKTTIVGTICAGYADGLLRSLGNNGMCYINRLAAPIIGRISMDLINVDLSNIPQEHRKIGQEIDIICEQQTPYMLTKKSGIIGYEVLTSLGNRYERKYIK